MQAEVVARVRPPRSPRGGVNKFITGRSSACPQPGEFLNDNIIDFYLAFVSRRFVTPLLKSVFLFNTHFFRLLERPGRL